MPVVREVSIISDIGAAGTTDVWPADRTSPRADPELAATGAHGGHYPFLDGLRGAAAAYVMAYHLLAWLPCDLPRWVTRLQQPVSFGHVAVSVFIVLSGYSLGLPVARSPGRQLRGGVGGYLRRRALRILPAYFAALAISAATLALIGNAAAPTVTSADLSVGSFLAHLLLVHNLSLAYAPTINMAHWSVAAEWQIYFLFPLLLLPAWRSFGAVGLVVTGFAAAAVPLVFFPVHHDLWWTCPWYVGLFAVGAAAATFERTRITVPNRLMMLAAVVALGAAYLAVHHQFHQDDVERPAVDFAKDTLAGTMVALLLVYGVASCNGSISRAWAVRTLESVPLRWLGARSYSLYLIHCTVLLACIAVAAKLRLSDAKGFTLRAFVGIPVSLAAASALHATCEQPFLRRRATAA